MASMALVETQMTMRQAEDRRIAYATAASVFVHALVLFTVSIASAPSTDFSSVPELSVVVSREDGHDREHEDSPSLERSSAPTDTLSEAIPAALPDNVPSEIEPPPVVASASPAPAQTHAADEGAITPVSEPEDVPTPAPATEGVLTTFGESDSAALANFVPTEAHVLPVDISPSEQKLLTQHVVEGAQGLENTDQTETRMSWEQDGETYTAVLTRQPAADTTGLERMMVEIVTERRGRQLRTQMQMKRLAFSNFTQLVDRWDNDVQLHDDQIVGRFHSNSQILLGYDRDATPRFFGKVTTAARSFALANSIGRRARSEIFPAGIETSAGRIALPPKFLPFASASVAAHEVEAQSFSSDTRITFYPDGTYGWRPARSDEGEQRQKLSRETTYILATRDTTLYVRGIVNGKVLVYSPDLIVIEDDLVYAHDPRSPDGHDYLGLVSDNYIEVARPSVTGPGDLEIDAAIYARRRFVVTNEQNRNGGTLFIYGSLTAGTLSATEPRYATKVVFDPRFEQRRPPGFPVTNRYELEWWDPHWRPVSGEQTAQAGFTP